MEVAEKWARLLDDKELPKVVSYIPPGLRTPGDVLEIFCQEMGIDPDNVMQEIVETAYDEKDTDNVKIYHSLTEKWGHPEHGPGDRQFWGLFRHGDREFEFCVVDGISNGTDLREWYELVEEDNEKG